MGRVRKIIETTQNTRALKRWDERVKIAENLSLSELRELRSETRQLQSRLNRINHIANSRLALPVIGSRAFKKPPKTDWTHRPQAWNGPVHPTGIASATTKSRLGDDLSIYHDCERSEMTIRQVRNNKEEDLSPFGIRLDVFRFTGSFLSLVIEMPKDAVQDLKRNHLLRLNTIVDSEKSHEMFARLNLTHGPNTEQIVREIDLSSRETWVEFDLYYTKFNENRGHKMWIDLIFESPSMNQITIRDVSVLRRPRAAI